MSIFTGSLPSRTGRSARICRLCWCYITNSMHPKKAGRTVGLKASGCSALVNLLVEQGLVERGDQPQRPPRGPLMPHAPGAGALPSGNGAPLRGARSKFSQLSPQEPAAAAGGVSNDPGNTGQGPLGNGRIGAAMPLQTACLQGRLFRVTIYFSGVPPGANVCRISSK